jgi:hypothetical protein
MDHRVKPGGDAVGMTGLNLAGERRDPGWALVSISETPLDIRHHFSYNPESRSSRGVTGDSRLMGRVRFLRAGLVTPLPGGPGIDPAGIMTGVRGASLKRGPRRRSNLRPLYRAKRGLG